MRSCLIRAISQFLESCSTLQMTGCRMQLEIMDGPRGSLAGMLLMGMPDVVSHAQWLVGSA